MITHEVTFKTYAIGFVSSLILTTLAFYLVAQHVQSEHAWPPHPLILHILLGLAFVQFIVQLIYFLHLGFEKKQRLNLVLFISTISVVLIVVIGSIWIINNLDYNMTQQQMDMSALKQG